MKKSVVVIEDEKDIIESIQYILENHGFEVTCFMSAEEFFSAKDTPGSCIYLIDWNLPGIKGIEIVRTIRLKDQLSPVFIISAYAKDDQVVEGLQSGADDYLTKPFNYQELLIRVQNAHKKMLVLQENLINVGLKLISEASSVVKDGVMINLTEREFMIFQHLHRNLNQPISREEIIDQFGKDLDITSRNIDVHIFSLRKKIQKLNIAIQTVWGKGYRLII
jgi:DNA-binding response OmpR family regulator